MNKVKRNIITIDENKCTGCGECIIECPEQAIMLVDTKDGRKARLVKELYCDGLGACLGACPTGALKVEIKKSVPYDDKATLKRIKEVAPGMLEKHKLHMQEHQDELQGGHIHADGSSCPGSRMMSWGEKKEQRKQKNEGKIESELRQWPVQLALINPRAPYFKGSDLVVAADCVPFAFADFHRHFLSGKSVAVGCPKLDDIDSYKEKLIEIFKVSGVKSVTVVNMEVPCCHGLQNAVKEAIRESGKNIPYCDIVVSIKGEIL